MAVFPSDSVRTKNWITETLTDADLEGQLDLLHEYLKAALNSSTGHTHDGTSNQSPKLNSGAVGSTFVSGLTTVTGVGTDYVMIADASDSNAPKKALVSDIVALATITPASQSEMEAATDNTKAVTPLAVNWHPGVAKAWVKWNGTGTPAVTSSWNFDSSITDHGTGMWTLTITTDFSSANWVPVGMRRNESASNQGFLSISDVSAQVAGTIRVDGCNYVGTLQDTSNNYLVCFGDQ